MRRPVAVHLGICNLFNPAGLLAGGARKKGDKTRSDRVQHRIDKNRERDSGGYVHIRDDHRLALVQDARKGEHTGRKRRRAEGPAVA